MNTFTSHLRRAVKTSSVSVDTTGATITPMSSSLTTRPRSSSLDSLDSLDEEEYFSKTYVPLSNLPTPPLSSHSNASSRQMSPEALFAPSELLDPKFIGPAIHLTNLIPPSTSLTPASPSHMQLILTRSNLPSTTIALAVNILDSLNPRFALAWRQSLPLTPSQHIDSIAPELIPLSALILAVQFVDDREISTRECVQDWGRGAWNCRQVNATVWCLLDNLGGRLLPLWEACMVEGALADMERAAGRRVVKENSRKGVGGLKDEEKPAVKSVEGCVATKEPFPPYVVDPGMD